MARFLKQEYFENKSWNLQGKFKVKVTSFIMTNLERWRNSHLSDDNQSTVARLPKMIRFINGSTLLQIWTAFLNMRLDRNMMNNHFDAINRNTIFGPFWRTVYMVCRCQFYIQLMIIL